MTRARILADYVSSGDELALKAPLAGPTFTGTVAIPNVANLETAVVANTAKVTNHNQTLAEINALDVTELGTVTSGTLSHGTALQGWVDASNTGVTFPAGHVIQTKLFALSQNTTSDTWTLPEKTSGYPGNGTGMQTVVFNSTNIEITGITATQGNLLLIHGMGVNMLQNANDGTYQWDLGFLVDGVGYNTNQVFFRKTDSSILPCSPYLIYTVPSGFTNKTISLAAGQQYYPSGTHDLRLAFYGSYMSLGANTGLSIQEIQQ